MKKYFKSINPVKAFRLFPLSSTFAIIATLALLLFTEYHENETLFKIGGAGYLGFLAAISSELWVKVSKAKYSKVVLSIPFLVFIAWYLYIMHESELPKHLELKLGYRYIASALILHLFVSFIPYLSNSNEEDFWEYNKYLFFRIFESVLFSLIIFAGLSLALLALDKLFELKVNGEWYGRLFIFLGGIFNSLYFLGRFPLLEYDKLITKPTNGYKVFSQYILIPIVIIYLILLYAYAGKIVIEGELPKGWIGYLTLCFSIIGIFSWLLNYFNLQFDHLTSTRLYKIHFFRLLTLPVILLLIAIYVRLAEYGLTENRYIVSALAFWLSGLTLAYGWFNNVHIKWIPISLVTISIIASFGGPIDMFSSSLNNQSSQLKSILTNNAILKNGEINYSAASNLDDKIQYQLKEKINAVGERSEFESLNEWTNTNTFENYNEEDHFSKSEYLIGQFNLTDIHSYGKIGGEEYFNLSSSRSDTIEIAGYSKMTFFTLQKNRKNHSQTVLIHNNNEISIPSYQNIPLESMVIQSYKQEQPIAQSKMTILIGDSTSSCKVIFEFLHGKIETGDVIIEGGQGWILN